MGKTRDLFKIIRDTKGTFHAKMGTITERNSKDLIEAEEIKKSWQEYTEELYKKDLHDTDNHDGVITHLQPDILECKVKWALGSIILKKTSNMPANLENSAVATGLEKVRFHSSPEERQCQRMLKLPHNCTHLTC